MLPSTIQNCKTKLYGTVDGWNPAPVEVGSLSHYLQGFSTIPGGCLGFQPSTVWNLQTKRYVVVHNNKSKIGISRILIQHQTCTFSSVWMVRKPYHCQELRPRQPKTSPNFLLQKFSSRPDAGECINDVAFDLYGTKLVPQWWPFWWRNWTKLATQTQQGSGDGCFFDARWNTARLAVCTNSCILIYGAPSWAICSQGLWVDFWDFWNATI